MRLVVAKRIGQRGAGLGNEMLPWAKGWIASQVLDAHLVGPSWGINQRRYYRNFNQSRLDFLLEDALQRLPHHSFTESKYRATGEDDFGLAIEKWADARGLANKKSLIVTVEGMWGGYLSIRNARAFLLSKLLNSRDAMRNVYQVTSGLDRNKLFVAVHMRSKGDGFVTPRTSDNVRGKFNILIPGGWYLWVCEALQEQFGRHLQFRFFTDRCSPEFDEAVRRFNPGQSGQNGLTECSDLLLMTQADLRVCSVSSYSLAASFLSEGPYLWYEPQLTLNDELYSLWGGEEGQMDRRSLISQSTRVVNAVNEPRAFGTESPSALLGTAMDTGEPLPQSLVMLLEQRLSSLDPRTNLLEYGCLPHSRQSEEVQSTVSQY
jgi:hypothetical protein